MKSLWSLMVVMAIGLMLVSCEYKDLYYGEVNPVAKMNISFDWKKLNDAQVQGMTVLFYNTSELSAEPIRYDFSGMQGGTARLTPGTYRVVAYNYDTETILYRSAGTYETLEAYTRESTIEECTQLTRSGMPRAAGTENEPVILEPDILYGVASNEVVAAADDSMSIRLIPERRYRTITVTIGNVPNLKYTGMFGGAISGMAASMMMASGMPTDDCATQAFNVSVIGSTTLQMTFRIFGHCPHGEAGIFNDHKLTIYAILADNSKWYYTLDITDKIHAEEQKKREEHKDDPYYDISVEDIRITLDEGLPVPKPIVNGSGFQPTVDGWQGEEIEVDM